MPEPATLALFALASLALLAVPGPAVLFVVARSLEHGRRAGVVSVLGVHAGSLVHVAAAALGLSALVASSATAFAVVRYAGAAAVRLRLVALGGALYVELGVVAATTGDRGRGRGGA